MYLPQKIKDYFGDGSNFGVNIQYFVEETPLGTAGSVKNAEEFLDDTFVVISGDGLTDMNLTSAINFHKQKTSLATLVLYKVDVPLDYGVVVTDDEGKITRFLEKPSWSEVFSDKANTGTYILEPEVLNYFEKGQNFDFSQNLFPILLRDKKPMYGFTTKEYWCDIGDLNAYLQAHYDIFDNKVKISTSGNEIKPGVWVGNGTEIHPSAELNAPCIIGSNCKIANSIIENFSIIGNNNVLKKHVSVKKSYYLGY
jgi:mannose-1-phosphate guanylyltransferase/phosphomannomutase